MKLRYQADGDFKKNEKRYRTHFGSVIIESAPQTRTIITNRGYKRYNFPYLYHLVTYTKFKQNIRWDGIYGLGLRVLFTNKPIETFDSLVAVCPTDWHLNGLVCTPHEVDGQRFQTRNDLVSFVIGLWWGTQHNIDSDTHRAWSGMTPDQVLECDWHQFYCRIWGRRPPLTNAVTLRSYLEGKSWAYGREFCQTPTIDATLIDESF